jgi:hypothetical protein
LTRAFDCLRVCDTASDETHGEGTG